jgi:hypothetical protein
MPAHKASTHHQQTITHNIQENGSWLRKIYLRAQIMGTFYYLFKWQENKHFQPPGTYSLDKYLF